EQARHGDGLALEGLLRTDALKVALRTRAPLAVPAPTAPVAPVAGLGRARVVGLLLLLLLLLAVLALLALLLAPVLLALAVVPVLLGRGRCLARGAVRLRRRGRGPQLGGGPGPTRP